MKTEEKNAAVRTSGAAEEIIVPVPAEHPAENENTGRTPIRWLPRRICYRATGVFRNFKRAGCRLRHGAVFGKADAAFDRRNVGERDRALSAGAGRTDTQTRAVYRGNGRSAAHRTDETGERQIGGASCAAYRLYQQKRIRRTYAHEASERIPRRFAFNVRKQISEHADQPAVSFIGKRAKIAEEAGADEKLENFEFESAFEHGEGRGRIKIEVEYSERNTEETARKPFLGTGLWHRVQRLNEIVSGYMQSSFVKAMDKNYIRPPVMRTNAILKNKYFNECLALWEFIESYEDAGYGITVSETVKDIPDEYVKRFTRLRRRIIWCSCTTPASP